MELTQLQQKILNAPESKIAVEASAAALKTATMTEKVRQLLLTDIPANRIAVITFTRMAAEELIARLGNDYKEGIYVGTIHALALSFAMKNGAKKEALDAIQDAEFDELFPICEQFDLSDEFDWVLVDEAQDTGEKELQFIFDLLRPSHFFVCFDLKQTIYQFKGCRPDILIEYLEREGATWYSLNQNFRNSHNILDYAKSIIKGAGLLDTSVATRSIQGAVLEMNYNPEYIAREIRIYDEYKDWAFLTRTNAELARVEKDFIKNGIPYNTFKQGDLNKSQLDKKLKENKVKLLTIHSAKGLGFPNVIVYGARWWNKSEYYINYVAATRAMNRLYWCKEPKKTYRKKRPQLDGFY